MSLLILDASVGIKTRVAEPLSDRAAAIIRTLDHGTTLGVPDLFFVECANVLWKYVRRIGYGAQKARADLERLLDLPLAVTPTADLAVEALDLAGARHHRVRRLVSGARHQRVGHAGHRRRETRSQADRPWVHGPLAGRHL
jgi:predicted nucleic acid-binding protein